MPVKRYNLTLLSTISFKPASHPQFTHSWKFYPCLPVGGSLAQFPLDVFSCLRSGLPFVIMLPPFFWPGREDRESFTPSKPYFTERALKPRLHHSVILFHRVTRLPL